MLEAYRFPSFSTIRGRGGFTYLPPLPFPHLQFDAHLLLWISFYAVILQGFAWMCQNRPKLRYTVRGPRYTTETSIYVMQNSTGVFFSIFLWNIGSPGLGVTIMPLTVIVMPLVTTQRTTIKEAATRDVSLMIGL